MRTTPHSLALICALALPGIVHAGPQTLTLGLDLRMLDMNGAPFGAFHLGHYANGLDATRPKTALGLPSQQLRTDLGRQAPDDGDTGVGTHLPSTLPGDPDARSLIGTDDVSLFDAQRAE